MPDQEQQVTGGGSELASFGEELRREREIRGISLKEIADSTKISRRFLEAIEHNDHRTLPAAVFTRGFVREYARYVGLNAEEMVTRYNAAAEVDDRVEKGPVLDKHPPVQVRDISPKPPKKKGIPPVWARINANAIFLLFIAAALAAVAWWAVRNRRVFETGPFESVTPTATLATAPPVATPIESVPPLAPPPSATDDSMLRLTVEATANSWVVLEADGKTVLSAEMTRGERKAFEANEAFRFRSIGNAAGLSLTLNGAQVPPLGGEGKVISNYVLDRELLLELRSGGPGAAISGTPR